jgi:alkanesulfonate monooxygenase SsuD/methylene tetrahydromethanopterin reductase-like flavin-dependent oxidoreductase (luciferase family)
MLEEGGRNLGDVRRSLMTGCVFRKTDAEVRERSKLYGDTTPEELREEGNIVGRGSQVAEQLSNLAEIGFDRVMLQWLDLDNLDGLDALAKAVL